MSKETTDQQQNSISSTNHKPAGAGGITFVDNPLFHKRRRANRLLDPMPVGEAPESRPITRCPDELRGYLELAHQTPLLTDEQRTHLLLQMNYLKFCATRAANDDKARGLLAEANTVRNRLAAANLLLLLRFVMGRLRKQSWLWREALSNAHLVLYRCIDNFDVSDKRCTFAYYVMISLSGRSCWRTTNKHPEVRTGEDVVFERLADGRDVDLLSPTAEDQNELMGELIGIAWKSLTDEREQTVIRLMYGLDGVEPQTLKAIGKSLKRRTKEGGIGVTQERVRQIERRALRKMETAFYKVLRDWNISPKEVFVEPATHSGPQWAKLSAKWRKYCPKAMWTGQ